MKNKKKIVSFLVSGKGSNFKAAAEKIISNYIHAEIGIVVSTSFDAPALKKSEELGVRSIVIEPKNFNSKEEYESELIKHLEFHKTDLVVAAGYMRILTPLFINRFRYKIINIHPSLLPAFPGKSAQQQALDCGVKITGCTTHFIDEGTDTGPIILQRPVSIEDNDDIVSLSTRIIKEEHIILVESIKLFCEEKLIIENNKVYQKS